MSILDDLFSLVDPKLADVYSSDPTKNRTTFVRGLQKVKTQFESGKQPRGAKAMWSASNNVVAFTPKIGEHAIVLNGHETMYIPAERFQEFISKLADAASNGSLDNELKADGETVSTTRKSVRSNASERAPRKGWSDERRARQQATIAARNAAKNK